MCHFRHIFSAHEILFIFSPSKPQKTNATASLHHSASAPTVNTLFWYKSGVIWCNMGAVFAYWWSSPRKVKTNESSKKRKEGRIVVLCPYHASTLKRAHILSTSITYVHYAQYLRSIHSESYMTYVISKCPVTPHLFHQPFLVCRILHACPSLGGTPTQNRPSIH